MKPCNPVDACQNLATLQGHSLTPNSGAAAAVPHNASSLTVSSASATVNMTAASPLVSPALRQQWRRAVQTATRLAVVAMKDGRRQFESCSTAGQELLQALAADILALQQLPTMKFGALEQLQGLREAAARKLSHRQVVKLGALQQSCQKLQQAVQTMEEALAAVAAASAQVSPAPGPSTPTSGHHAAAATPDVAAGGAAGSSAREVSGLELGSGVLPGRSPWQLVLGGVQLPAPEQRHESAGPGGGALPAGGRHQAATGGGAGGDGGPCLSGPGPPPTGPVGACLGSATECVAGHVDPLAIPRQ